MAQITYNTDGNEDRAIVFEVNRLNREGALVPGYVPITNAQFVRQLFRSALASVIASVKVREGASRQELYNIHATDAERQQLDNIFDQIRSRL